MFTDIIIDTTNTNFFSEEPEIHAEKIKGTAETGARATNNVKVHPLSKKNKILENIFMNNVINKSNKFSKNEISRHEIEKRTSGNLSKGEINIFIPERNLSIDQVILQGELGILFNH